MRIIVVEDEPQIAKYIAKALTQEGFAVDIATSGAQLLEAIGQTQFDCAVLDLNLPDVDGLELLIKLREAQVPALILSARNSPNDIIKGFELGGDDYLAKPFNITELVLRVSALIRRTTLPSQTESNIELLPGLSYEPVKRIVKKDDELINLSNKELGILEYLISKRGQTVSQEDLLEHVWDREVNIFSDTVRTTIKTLRQKIDPDKKLISTIRGRGYVIN
jgi:DNA-binding response OmpR family regulator